MDNALIKKVRKIEIKTRSLSHQIFAGEYHSAFKGRGMAFSEVREYQYGDDVRNMDWNVTARLRSPYVKVYELTVVLLVDVSSSSLFGTVAKTKRELVAEIAAVLSFSASINNDKVGALFFSSKVEKFIPPKKGRSHLLRILSELLEYEPQNNGTDISEALRFLSNAIKKRCTAFLLSDLIDVNADGSPKYEEALKIAANRHELNAINIYDPREREIPNIGLVRVKDAETGAEGWIDTSNKMVRNNYRRWSANVLEKATTLFNRYRVDSVSISTKDDYVKSLISFFKKK